MSGKINIKANNSILIQFYLIIIGVLALSFLRPFLFISLPLLAISFIILFKTRYSINVLFLGACIFVTSLISSLYVHEFNVSNAILSFYFICPVFLIFFSGIKMVDKMRDSYFEYFMKILMVILIANDCIGFIQFAINPRSDDSFVGFYGINGLGLHTLSLINFIVGAYYFFIFQYHKTKFNLGLFIFFFTSAFCCFYGLGLIVFVLSIFAYKFSFRTFLKSIAILILIVSLVVTLFYLFRARTLSYNYGNIEKVALFFNSKISKEDEAQIPRKIILYKNYINVYPKDFGLFMFGSGPGTFNSRTSFVLNGDYSRTGLFESILGTHTPAYALKYVYPLWNSKVVSHKFYTDGTRNEPFSSVIAMLAEYGFFISVLLSILIFHNYKTLIRRIDHTNLSPDNIAKSHIYRNYIKFISLFILLNLFTDNFLEYPEIIIVYVVIFKLIDMAIVKLVPEVILVKGNN